MTTAAEREALQHPSVMAETDAGVRRAVAAVIELQRKREAKLDRLEAIRRERDEVSYDAVLSNGASPARRHLDRLLGEFTATEGELLVIDAALKSAHLKCAAARERAERSEAESDGHRAIELCGILRSEATAAGDALVSYRLHLEAFLAAVAELRGMNYGPPVRSVELQVERAVGTALSGLKLSPPAVLAPSNRVTMPTIAENICQTVEGQVRRVIGGQGEAA